MHDTIDRFHITTDTQEPGLGTAMEVIYQWRYDPDVDELRTLYCKAAEAQWIADRDLDWSQEIDLDRFATTPLGAALPIEETSYWKSLPRDTIVELMRRTASFRLSNFLHGEQGALMVAGQLVNAVPHTDAKFYAATQTMDEARHVDVFHRYIRKLDEVRPIAASLKHILDETLTTGDWMKKLVGMQIVVEGLALYSFRDMRNLTEEPLLKELLTYVARDEARHHAYGVQYVRRCVPELGDAAREELEDFAVEAAASLIDMRNQGGFATTLFKIWSEVGIDATELLTCISNERAEITRRLPRGRRFGPVQGFVVPTLRKCGLLSERAARRFHELLRTNLGASAIGETLEEFMAAMPDLPEDTAAWVLGRLD
jgi:hypothetical protein